jgi:hypothetical protein
MEIANAEKQARLHRQGMKKIQKRSSYHSVCFPSGNATPSFPNRSERRKATGSAHNLEHTIN